VHGCFRRLGDLGRVLLDLGQETVGAEHEHAAVAVIAAVGDEAFGGIAVRLFDEALDLVAVADTGSSCLSIMARESGYRRVPAPPERMTG
jgi:hypothetical protein